MTFTIPHLLTDEQWGSLEDEVFDHFHSLDGKFPITHDPSLLSPHSHHRHPPNTHKLASSFLDLDGEITQSTTLTVSLPTEWDEAREIRLREIVRGYLIEEMSGGYVLYRGVSACHAGN
jgi:hypothetical protein